MELQKKEQPICVNCKRKSNLSVWTAKERATYLCELQHKERPICVNCNRKSDLSV